MVLKMLRWLAVVAPVSVATLLIFSLPSAHADRPTNIATDQAVAGNARVLLNEGRRVFRFETFGDEAFWGDTLKLHRAIAGSKLGGVGRAARPGTAPRHVRSDGGGPRLTSHAKGGFYHDGRFPDLMTVVEHYSQFMKLGVSEPEKRDLVEYLKSL